MWNKNVVEEVSELLPRLKRKHLIPHFEAIGEP